MRESAGLYTLKRNNHPSIRVRLGVPAGVLLDKFETFEVCAVPTSLTDEAFQQTDTEGFLRMEVYRNNPVGIGIPV